MNFASNWRGGYACLEEHRTDLKAKFEAEGVNAEITKGGIKVTKKEE